MTAPSNKGKGECYRWLVAHLDHRGDECLTWPFTVDQTGRGQLGYCGRSYKAHRLMCQMAHGPQPSPKHEAGHSCGKGHEACVHPQHLGWVTRSENGKDRRRHGTAVTTRYGYTGKLTKDQVAEIQKRKAEGAPTLTLAREFNVSTRTIDYWAGGLRERRGIISAPLSHDGDSYRVRRIKAARGKVQSTTP